MQVMEEWLYSGDEEVYNKTVLEEKGKELNELGGKVYKKFNDWTKLSESYNKLEQCINLNIKKLNNEFDNLSQNKPTTLNKAECDELQVIITSNNNILNEGRINYAQYPKLGDAPASWESVDKSSDEFVKKCGAVFTKADARIKEEQKKRDEEKKLKDKQEAESKKKAAEEELKKKQSEDITMKEENNVLSTDEKVADINMDVD